MSNRSAISVLALTGLALAIGVSIAWQKWPPLLRYRQREAIAEAKTTVRNYLNGRDSLGSAARELGTVLTRWDELSARIGERPAPTAGSMEIETLEITPPNVHANDPRVDELFLNAMRLTVPAVSPRFQALVTAELDSVITARGYRIIR